MAHQTFASCRCKFKGLLLPGPNFSERRKERVRTSSRWGLEEVIRRGFIALSVVALAHLGRPQVAPAAGQSPSVTIFVQTVGADSRVTEHRDGDAIPVGARYRVQIGNLEGGGPVTVKAILPGGKEQTLISGASASGSSLDLPQGDDWYQLPREPGDVKIVSAHNAGTTEHLMRAVDTSPDADVRQWNLKGGEAGRSSALPRSQYALPQSSPDLSSQVSAFTKLASAIASAREPLLRGGIGARIFRDAAPGVVLVIVNNGLGSGIILNRAGQILTNWHVVRGAKSIGVILKPPAGQRLRPTDMYEAHVAKYDEVADLAVIELDQAPADLVVLKLRDEGSVEVGSTVHAIGHPSGEYWTYTEGVISQVRTDYEWTGEDQLRHKASVIQTQTPINPGNSGGPLLDEDAKVIGINSFSEAGKQGLNFAIGVADVKRFLSSGGNRSAEIAPSSVGSTPQRADCELRRYDTVVDQKTKKLVTPIDTKCRGRPNLYLRTL